MAIEIRLRGGVRNWYSYSVSKINAAHRAIVKGPEWEERDAFNSKVS